MKVGDKKIVLMNAGTMEWKPVGVFDDLDSIKRYLKEEYKLEYENFEGEFDDWDDWLYNVSENKIYYINEIK